MAVARVVRLHEHGDAGVLRHERLDLPPPGPGEVTLAVEAIEGAQGRGG